MVDATGVQQRRFPVSLGCRRLGERLQKGHRIQSVTYQLWPLGGMLPVLHAGTVQAVSSRGIHLLASVT